MATKRGIALTLALGFGLGLFSWLGDAELSPSHGVYEVFGSTPARIAIGGCLVFVSLLVGRLWVVAALAGPVIALAILGAAGETVYEDGTAAPLNVVAIFGLFYLGILMAMMVGIRKGVDFLRLRWAESQRRPPPATGPDRRV
jgi:hypothetical protein